MRSGNCDYVRESEIFEECFFGSLRENLKVDFLKWVGYTAATFFSVLSFF